MRVMVFSNTESVNLATQLKKALFDNKFIASMQSWIPTKSGGLIDQCKVSEIDTTKELVVDAFITSDDEMKETATQFGYLELAEYMRRFKDETATMLSVMIYGTELPF